MDAVKLSAVALLLLWTLTVPAAGAAQSCTYYDGRANCNLAGTQEGPACQISADCITPDGLSCGNGSIGVSCSVPSGDVCYVSTGYTDLCGGFVKCWVKDPRTGQIVDTVEQGCCC
jgi:hypothetical protein